MDERNSPWERDYEYNYANEKIRNSNFWRRYFWQILTVGSLILVLILSSTIIFLLVNRSSNPETKVLIMSPSPTVIPATSVAQQVTQIPTNAPGPTMTPPPSPTPVNTVPCQADASWSGWSGSKDWRISNGMLVNDGTAEGGGPTIVAPCQLGNIVDYAVETKIQVVHWQQCCYSQFAIVVRAASLNDYWQGYSVGDDLQGPTTQISADAGDYGSSLGNAPFAPGSAYHTYRVEVKGNRIKLFIDSGIKLDVSNNQHLSGGQVGFWSFGVQLNISSFKITAL